MKYATDFDWNSDEMSENDTRQLGNLGLKRRYEVYSPLSNVIDQPVGRSKPQKCTKCYVGPYSGVTWIKSRSVATKPAMGNGTTTFHSKACGGREW